jgi:hypothetical protein
LKLYGKLIKQTKTIKETFAEQNDDSISFREQLELCLIQVCKELDIQVPLWLKKNTKEFVNHHRTFFTSEHFVEKIYFDKFEIRIEQL